MASSESCFDHTIPGSPYDTQGAKTGFLYFEQKFPSPSVTHDFAADPC
jgi:hypothetical protein